MLCGCGDSECNKGALTAATASAPIDTACWASSTASASTVVPTFTITYSPCGRAAAVHAAARALRSSIVRASNSPMLALFGRSTDECKCFVRSEHCVHHVFSVCVSHSPSLNHALATHTLIYHLSKIRLSPSGNPDCGDSFRRCMRSKRWNDGHVGRRSHFGAKRCVRRMQHKVLWHRIEPCRCITMREVVLL